MKGLPARVPGALMALLAVCACRPDSPAASDASPSEAKDPFPLHLAGADGELVLAAPPRRVLPANAAWVDFVSLLVGPERVAALPPEAFGYSRLTGTAGAWAELPPFPIFEGERVLALAPDLVLAHTWQNPETIASLRQAGIPVLVARVPARWDEITATLEQLGTALGEAQRTRALLAELAERARVLRARAAPFAHLAVLSYTNLGSGGWTSGANTTADVLLGLAGLVNAAARAQLVGDVPADAERLLALAPDVFLVGQPDRSEHAPPSAEFLLTETALASLAAIRARRIVALAPALFTSASPELLTGAERLVTELERLDREHPFPRR